MGDMTTSNILAYVNIVLGMIGFVILLLRTLRRWTEYPHEMKLLLSVTLLFILALLETSAEQIARDVPVGINTFVIFIVKMFLIYVLWSTRAALYRTGTRQPDNNGNNIDNENPNEDVFSQH